MRGEARGVGHHEGEQADQREIGEHHENDGEWQGHRAPFGRL
jgi:hypothetical protein